MYAIRSYYVSEQLAAEARIGQGEGQEARVELAREDRLDGGLSYNFV